MNIKTRVVLSLFLIAICLIVSGLLIDTKGHAIINVVMLLVGVSCFFLAISAFAFAKRTSKTASEVMREAIDWLITFSL